MHPKAVTAYLNRVGADIINFRRALIKIWRGHYYHERATIRINPDGSVVCSVKEFAPTKEESEAMKEALAGVDFPLTVGARSLEGLTLQGESFQFMDRATGLITMVQEKVIQKNGSKTYLPWVMLSTGEWVSMEPDAGLPFWKPEKRLGPGARIMVHEGAKTAAFVTELVESGGDHPWLDELSRYEHWGMIGGALAPHRTNYSELTAEAPKEVVYVCDRDRPGESALQKVSMMWGKSLKGIRFGDKFPETWDMADDMPEDLFGDEGRYIGPKLRELMEPATWATETIPTGAKGRPITIVKFDFAEEWLHCIRPEVFIHRDWPSKLLSANEFNSMVAPYSLVDDTARLLKKDSASKSAALKYDPSKAPGAYGGEDGGRFINTHVPSRIEALDEDASMFLEFMEHLCPDSGDRFELMRWSATLIARPDVRMHYGVLMISETQGVGKGTLGEKILCPLVGPINTSYPTEAEIVDSAFNTWLAHKRLAVVHEIYAGHSSKAYNKMKSLITDRFVTVSQKYIPNYEIECWINVFACSNSKRAIKLSMDDRRWFVPQLTEEKRTPLYWDSINLWLTNGGGLGVIKHWAEQFIEEHGPVVLGADAPWSILKKEMVEEGYSPGQQLVVQTLERLKGELNGEEIFVLDTDLVELIKQQIYDGRFSDKLERLATVRSVAKAAGWSIGKTRATVKAWGPQRYNSRIIATSQALAAVKPGDLCNEKMPSEERRWPVAILNERII